MEDYYFDELLAVMEEYSIIHETHDEEGEEQVSPMEFLGGGGGFAGFRT